jgi:hypothetical protein
MKLVDALSWLMGVIYKSLFLTGDQGFRRAHILSKLTFAMTILLLLATSPGKSYVLMPVIISLSLLHPGFEWLIAVSTLTGIVGLLLGGSAYLLSLVGIYAMRPIDILIVAVRTICVGVSLVFMVNMFSPIEFYNLLYYLGAKKMAVTPLLVARIIPLGVRSFIDSLMIGRLKREPLSSRIPPAVASMIEAGWFIEESSLWKLKVSSKQPIPLERSYEHTIILLLASLVVAILQTRL